MFLPAIIMPRGFPLYSIRSLEPCLLSKDPAYPVFLNLSSFKICGCQLPEFPANRLRNKALILGTINFVSVSFFWFWIQGPSLLYVHYDNAYMPQRGGIMLLASFGWKQEASVDTHALWAISAIVTILFHDQYMCYCLFEDSEKARDKTQANSLPNFLLTVS